MTNHNGPVLVRIKVWTSEEGRNGNGPVITRHFFVPDRSRAISSIIEASRREAQTRDDHTRRISDLVIAGLAPYDGRSKDTDLDYWGPSDTMGFKVPNPNDKTKHFDAEIEGFNITDCTQESV